MSVATKSVPDLHGSFGPYGGSYVPETLLVAVRQLAEGGLLTAVAHQRVARGGMRTVYRITPRGRDRFRELLHAQFAADGDLRQTLYGPMLFLHLADLKLVAEALRHQIDLQNARLAEIRKLRRQWAAMLPTGSRHLMQHMAEQCRLDLRWLRAVLLRGLSVSPVWRCPIC